MGSLKHDVKIFRSDRKDLADEFDGTGRNYLIYVDTLGIFILNKSESTITKVIERRTGMDIDMNVIEPYAASRGFERILYTKNNNGTTEVIWDNSDLGFKDALQKGLLNINQRKATYKSGGNAAYALPSDDTINNLRSALYALLGII